MKVFHYGCDNNRVGHFVHAGLGMSRHSQEVYNFLENNPWKYEIDGGLCPKGPEVEGIALIHHKDGWTAMSFWDRSVDKRGKSNSNFIAEGDYTFDAMVLIAIANFPSIFARFQFPIVEAKS